MVETPDPSTPLEKIRKAGWLLTRLGALVMLLAFAFPVEHQLRLATQPGRATGTVVDYALVSVGWRTTSYSYVPVIEFTTADGTPGRFAPDASWPGVADQKGMDVPVAYNPANPSQATIDDIRIVLFPLIGVGVLGLLILLSGTWVLTRFTSSTESSNGVAA